ncbi:MAG: pre-peptidase C-terminal domain-containing protein [Gemmatimonadaceae bacterium]
MMHRLALTVSCALLAALMVGCGDDGPSGSDDPGLVVTPVFRGVLEDDTLRLAATLNGQPAAVTWEVQHDSIATVNAEGLVTGLRAGFTAVTATSTSNPQMKRSASITVIPVPVLASGVARTGLSGATGTQRFFKIVVPAGTTKLTITMSGGTGDADLYVRFGQLPTLGTFDCAPFLGGNAESCTFDNPAVGTWFIMLDAFAAYAGARLVGTLTPAP